MLPIQLDIQTLSVVLILITAFLTFVIIFIWLTQKTYTGFGMWVISNIAVAGGILLLGFDGMLADLAGTSLTFSAVLIGYEGNLRFLKLKSNAPFTLSLFALQFAALILFRLSGDNAVWQVAFTSLLVGGVSGICGFVFFKQSSKDTGFSYKFTGVTYFIFALVMISRSIFMVYTGGDNNIYKPDGIQPAFFIVYILFEIIWTFNYINLNSNRLYNELKQMQTELEKLATTDFLTGINNNRKFFEIAETDFLRARRFRYPLSVIVFDIDFFKRVNDEYGHSAGDRVLIEISETCGKLLRGTDAFGRMGGEEFAVLLSHTDIHGAKTVAEYLRAAIENLEIRLSAETIRVSASFGVTQLNDTDARLKNMLDRADELLYKAKSKGRNRVVDDLKELSQKELAAA